MHKVLYHVLLRLWFQFSVSSHGDSSSIFVRVTTGAVAIGELPKWAPQDIVSVFMIFVMYCMSCRFIFARVTTIPDCDMYRHIFATHLLLAFMQCWSAWSCRRAWTNAETNGNNICNTHRAWNDVVKWTTPWNLLGEVFIQTLLNIENSNPREYSRLQCFVWIVLYAILNVLSIIHVSMTWRQVQNWGKSECHHSAVFTNFCNLFEDRARLDEIYGCLIFKHVAVTCKSQWYNDSPNLKAPNWGYTTYLIHPPK